MWPPAESFLLFFVFVVLHNSSSFVEKNSKMSWLAAWMGCVTAPCRPYRRRRKRRRTTKKNIRRRSRRRRSSRRRSRRRKIWRLAFGSHLKPSAVTVSYSQGSPGPDLDSTAPGASAASDLRLGHGARVRVPQMQVLHLHAPHLCAGGRPLLSGGQGHRWVTDVPADVWRSRKKEPTRPSAHIFISFCLLVLTSARPGRWTLNQTFNFW